MVVLEIVGISKSFSRFQALRNVTLRLAESEIVGLIGPNGAGKTTLVNLISGMIPVTAGEIGFRGRSIRGLPPHRIARLGIGRTFQIAPAVDGTTVLDYVTIGALFGRACGERRVASARRKAEQVVEMVGLAMKSSMHSDRLNLVDRKRMELARVLAMRPSLILLDEVMAGLDRADMSAILEVIRNLRGAGITVLLIEHVVEAVASVADRIAVLVLGEILTEGKPEAVLRDERVLEAYLGSRFRGAAGGATVGRS
jgi:branched-chain amino acid transport system ATP-binding protein